MLEIDCTGFISCHKTIKKLNISNIEMNIITDEKVVSEIVSNTIGVVPVFKFENKYYNEYEIERMLDNGVDFNKKNNIIKTEEVVKVTSKLKNEEVK